MQQWADYAREAPEASGFGCCSSACQSVPCTKTADGGRISGAAGAETRTTGACFGGSAGLVGTKQAAFVTPRAA